jgi:hypothetical protein
MAETVPALTISEEKVCFVVLKAREFDVKDVPTVPDDGSNPTDDRDLGVLEDRGDDAIDQELTDFISAMSEDEQVDLVALAWLGRGDGGLSEWDELRAEAQRQHNRRSICSACHCCPTIWRRRSRNSVSGAPNSRVTICRMGSRLTLLRRESARPRSLRGVRPGRRAGPPRTFSGLPHRSARGQGPNARSR